MARWIWECVESESESNRKLMRFGGLSEGPGSCKNQ